MSELSIRPLHDRVVIRQVEAEAVSAGGIVIPGSAAEKPAEGLVLATGKGKTLPSGEVVPLDVQVGDKIMFGKYVGTEVTVDGEDLLVLNEEEIIAVLV